MAYRVLIDGATLSVKVGTQLTEKGDVTVTRSVIGRAGQVIEQELADEFVERLEAGEEHANSLVERISAQEVDQLKEASEPPPVDYESMHVDDLAKLVDERGITIEEGSGANGNIIKDDYVAALKADDES